MVAFNNDTQQSDELRLVRFNLFTEDLGKD